MSAMGGIVHDCIARPIRENILHAHEPCSRAFIPDVGGKTASLKTLGLLVLMAKAGLFLPLEGPCEPPPTLQWFDKVLADVGDSQDLMQSLSTFSGHVQRLRRILTATGQASLVLLDEVSRLQHIATHSLSPLTNAADTCLHDCAVGKRD